MKLPKWKNFKNNGDQISRNTVTQQNNIDASHRKHFRKGQGQSCHSDMKTTYEEILWIQRWNLWIHTR